MREILNSFIEAFELIISLDKEIYGIILLTIVVTVLSTIVAAALAVPTGIIIGSSEFRAKRLLIRLINTLMGLPPVVAGLIVYLLLSRKGPLGDFALLFTPAAMVIAQVLIILPIITGITIGAVKLKVKAIRETCAGLGLGNIRTLFMLFHECRYPVMSAVMAGYGRAIAEVGAVMLVGGNIQYNTRVMTTAIVLETGKGNYDRALALGIILLALSFLVNWLLQHIQEDL
ncbi:MAG: ABC transporter permease [Clostridia bacterium]|nr:ABC transporter permease [Clostridia bacterium]